MRSEYKRDRMPRRGRIVGMAAAAVLLSLAMHARAAEQVTLRNGFTVRCDHHALVEGHMRLYLSAGEGDYIEFAPGEVADIREGPRCAGRGGACRSAEFERGSKTDSGRLARDVGARRNGA